MSRINNEMHAIYSFIFAEAFLIEKSFRQAQASRDTALVYQQMKSIQQEILLNEQNSNQ